MTIDLPFDSCPVCQGTPELLFPLPSIWEEHDEDFWCAECIAEGPPPAEGDFEAFPALDAILDALGWTRRQAP